MITPFTLPPKTWLTAALRLLLSCMPVAPARAAGSDHVILLHGLARTSASMEPLAKALRDAGYVVHNVDYPSRTTSVAKLAEQAITPAIAAARQAGAKRIDFVTHSMGGILVRAWLAQHTLPELGRVVMLGPPNQGSEVVDQLGAWRLFGAINGPAGRELGTGPASLPNALGPVNYPVGVIAGSRSINGINSLLLIPGADDGKVTVERTKVAGMADHIVIATTHTFMMRNAEVIRQVRHFLAIGAFAHEVRP